MFRRAFLLLSAMLPLVGQPSAPSIPAFRAYRETTKTATAEVITIQLPSRSAKRAEFSELFLYCEADIDVTIEQGGGAATSTSFAPVNINLRNIPSVASAYHTSNTTGGTTIDKLTLFGGSTAIIKLTGINLLSGQTVPQNLTIRTTAFTGLLRVRVEWQERP
jgi:hypothetical protein